MNRRAALRAILFGVPAAAAAAPAALAASLERAALPATGARAAAGGPGGFLVPRCVAEEILAHIRAHAAFAGADPAGAGR